MTTMSASASPSAAIAAATLSRRLAWLRRQAGLSQVGAARATGLRPGAWRRMERTGRAWVGEIAAAAVGFGVEVADLLADPETPPPLAVRAVVGQAPVPIFTTRCLRVVTPGDAECVYLPEVMLDAAALHEPFAMRVDENLCGPALGVDEGDLLICERDWRGYVERTAANSAVWFLVQTGGTARLLRGRRDLGERLAAVGRVVGVVVGSLRLPLV